MTPSISCWIPNSREIIANGRSFLASVLLSAATPIADNEVPAMKLAEAEKHIALDPFVVRMGVPSYIDLIASETSLGHATSGGDDFLSIWIVVLFMIQSPTLLGCPIFQKHFRIESGLPSGNLFTEGTKNVIVDRPYWPRAQPSEFILDSWERASGCLLSRDV